MRRAAFSNLCIVIRSTDTRHQEDLRPLESTVRPSTSSLAFTARSRPAAAGGSKIERDWKSGMTFERGMRHDAGLHLRAGCE